MSRSDRNGRELNLTVSSDGWTISTSPSVLIAIGPAAGKTGTSRDGWFAGYTKDLLAIVWVGYDDNRDLNLEGARSALPIWTEFMMKAAQLHPPDPSRMYFSKPPGIEFVRIDPESMLMANPSCENTFEEAFIAGTAPKSFCPLHGFRLFRSHSGWRR